MSTSLLIASPQLRDPSFERTVVLVWHHDDDGAVGVIINRSFDQSIDEVLTPPEPMDLSPYAGQPVLWGGPVEPESGTLITDHEVTDEEGWNLEQGVSVTRSLDRLMDFLRRQVPFQLALGYAGWGPGQLEQEFEEGSWIFAPIDPELILHAPLEDRYELTLASIGMTIGGMWHAPADS